MPDLIRSDEVTLLEPPPRIIDRLPVWRESRVSTPALVTCDRALLEAVLSP